MMEVQASLAIAVFILLAVLVVAERFVTALIVVIDFVWELMNQ